MLSKSKWLLIFSIVLLAAVLYWKHTRTSVPKLNQLRVLLAKVRGGDYAHAGDVEAIELILKKIMLYLKKKNNIPEFEELPENICKDTKTLDIGCGFGGTANYLYEKGFKNISGFDIDKASIGYASYKYPKVTFCEEDVKNVVQKYGKNKFSFLYMFNSLCTFFDQAQSLKDLAEIAEPGAFLVIFDYSYLKPEKQHGLEVLFGNQLKPVVLTSLRQWLNEAGWEVLEETDLSQHFIQWYSNLLNKLELRKATFLEQFSEETINKFYAVYANILRELNNQVIGGMVVYAKKK